MTQQQLAAEAGVDDSLISRLERQERDISAVGYASVVRIARALCPTARPDEVFPVDGAVPSTIAPDTESPERTTTA